MENQNASALSQAIICPAPPCYPRRPPCLSWRWSVAQGTGEFVLLEASAIFYRLPSRVCSGRLLWKPKFVRLNKWAQRREAENEYEVGENMSDETYLLQRIYGLETELHYLAESSRQQQFRHNTELSRLQDDNRKLQARLGVLQAENNTLRVQLQAALSVISYLEQRLQFHVKSLLEQETTAEITHRLSNAA